ncbi:MAG: phosphate signaling complex protein PhoU [Pseudanabaenaceae cyanobacterium bins.68]|nr:phosphate signaling complex protein PhoU [Pseudanabaenaceae cyanobacterium bins.68]
MVISDQFPLSRQILKLEQEVLRMGALVENSFWLAHSAMFERNLENATQLDSQDKQVDILYRHVEVECLDLITRYSPTTPEDLRLLSTFMQLVRDLERIGDYAENLGEIAIKLFPYPPPPHLELVRIMSNRCRAMLAMSLGALSNYDAELAAQVKFKDDAVDADYAHIYDLISQSQDYGALEPLLLMILVIHHLERMADHATNIGQRIAYIVTGKR